MDSEQTHFGEHLMIDGYGGDQNLLNDSKLVLNALEELPTILEMNILEAPRVSPAPGNDKKDPGGWSGFVIIAESHISIHTFPKRGFVSIDIYTCRNGLDTKKVEDYFTKKFDLKELETNFVKRGTRYPAKDIYQ